MAAAADVAVVDGGSATIRAGAAGDAFPAAEVAAAAEGEALAAGWRRALAGHARRRRRRRPAPPRVRTPAAPGAFRAAALEAAFEELRFDGAYVQDQSVVTLYAQGALTGLVFDVGAAGARATPVLDGAAPRRLARATRVGGAAVTAELLRLLQRAGAAAPLRRRGRRRSGQAARLLRRFSGGQGA
jgi:actin-related protein